MTTQSRKELTAHHTELAAADREIERLDELVSRLENQIAEPAVAEADLKATIKREAARLLATFGFGDNTGARDDQAHLQAAAAVEARRRAAAVAQEALAEVKAKLVTARERRVELFKRGERLVAAVLEEVVIPAARRHDSALAELAEMVDFLHAAQGFLPAAFGAVGRWSQWNNLEATLPLAAEFQRVRSFRPDSCRYAAFFRDAKNALARDPNAVITLPKLAA
jgi:hypothetical protein